MQKLTLNKAAKEAKIAKSTLLEAIKSGRMSAPKNDKGHYAIDPSELFRVFGQKPVFEKNENHKENHNKTSNIQDNTKALEDRLEMLEKERNREREQLTDQINDLRNRLDKAEGERTKLTALLTDGRAKRTNSPKKGIWSRFLGK